MLIHVSIFKKNHVITFAGNPCNYLMIETYTNISIQLLFIVYCLENAWVVQYYLKTFQIVQMTYSKK